MDVTQYQLRVALNDEQQMPNTETETNDTKANADAITFDAPIAGLVSLTTDQDWFVLNTDAPKVVTVSFAASTSSRVWLVKVYNSSDASLAQMDVGNGSSFNVSLPSAGSYYVVVCDSTLYVGVADVQYQLTVASTY